MIIRVMQEVKTREDEYLLVKDIASRVEGLPLSTQLARRERRLLAHGKLQRVHGGENFEMSLEHSSSSSQVSTNDFVPQSDSSLLSTHRSRSMRTGRMSPCVSRASSDFSEHASISSTSSEAPVTPAQTQFEIDRYPTSSPYSLPGSLGISPSRCQSSQAMKSGDDSRSCAPGPIKDKTKQTPVYAFVFTDLILLATTINARRRSKSIREDRETWRLLEDAGMSRILAITDHSGNLGRWSFANIYLLDTDSVTQVMTISCGWMFFLWK